MTEERHGGATASLENLPASLRRVSGILDGAAGLPAAEADADYLAGHEIGCRVHRARAAAGGVSTAGGGMLGPEEQRTPDGGDNN